MKIENHKLVGVTMKVEYVFDEPTPIQLVPEIVVIHYAVTETAGATAAVLKDREYVSCHVTIDSTGRVIQMVPFNRRAGHAGPSSYKGREGVSAFSLGIEISNPGPLIKHPDGSLKTVYGRTWTGPSLEATHKGGRAPKNWTHWAEYSQVELDLCAHICELWRREYGIKDIVGHDDIAPNRKFDPGPAFPLAWLRATVFPSSVAETIPPPSEGFSTSEAITKSDPPERA